jgi:predicted transcriptional regulator of viral defense system
VVSSAPLAALGLSKHAVGRLADRGSLHRIHTGVYAVGHRPQTRHGWWLAAVLAAGPGAALGYRSPRPSGVSAARRGSR